ncbi:hypothetical protein EBT16_09555, partial [bacterium]|nr:hypothetical protein [bacterium]
MSEFKVGDEVLVRATVSRVNSRGVELDGDRLYPEPGDVVPASRLTDIEAEVARLKGVCAERYDEIHRLKAELAEAKTARFD